MYKLGRACLRFRLSLANLGPSPNSIGEGVNLFHLRAEASFTTLLRPSSVFSVSAGLFMIVPFTLARREPL